MKFEQQKQKQFKKKDLSDEGKWDERISGLCKKINSKKNYYTTSSCSGRVILIKDSEKKERGLFLFKSHDKISFEQLKKALNKIKFKGLVWFKLDSCILHVVCENVESAQKLIDKAKFAGWKRSGMMASRGRVVCELLSTENMSFPIMDGGGVVVDDGFLELVVKLSNEKLERIWKKIRKLEKVI